VTSSLRVCPVCGGTRVARLFRQRFERPPAFSPVSGYDVVACDACGAAFADGIPPQAEFNAYYREVSKYENELRGGKESECDERRFRDVAEALAPWIPARRDSILEIGCATGRQLELVRELGFQNVEGLDPSPACAAAAWELYGIPVLTKTVFDPLPRQYGFVILSHVLEHVEDMQGAVTCLRAAVSPAGRIYCETPDASRMAGRADAPYQEFSTEHINFFSPQSLINLFGAHGFAALVTGRALRHASPNTTCPVAWGVFEKCEVQRDRVRDDETEPGLTRYIEECGGEDARIRARIRAASRGRSIIVWGVGTHTQRLLAVGALDGIEIAAFVDSNSKYQSGTLRGVGVVGTDAILGRQEPILISSHGFQREIQIQIRVSMNMPNELILLYAD